MSRFFSAKYSRLIPYTPGEQPKDQQYVKLNTNESPFPPSPLAVKLAQQAAQDLQLYSDPECRDLMQTATACFGLSKEQLLFTNGSDEILNFAFMAFCDEAHPVAFADITYGFYTVFADLHGIPYTQIPLRADFTLDPEDYMGLGKTIFIANPNANTGLALPLSDIERIVASNPDNVVVVDEAYVDFGGESAIRLIDRYDNLLVVQTFSKSRSMAGARIGFGAGSAALIRDLNTIKYSTNPYNINRMTMAAAIGALQDQAYFLQNCRTICETREWTIRTLRQMGFTVTESKGNFVLAGTPAMGGLELYERLRARGILVRHFETERLRDYNRITIGSMQQMQTLVENIKIILEEST